MKFQNIDSISNETIEKGVLRLPFKYTYFNNISIPDIKSPDAKFLYSVRHFSYIFDPETFMEYLTSFDNLNELEPHKDLEYVYLSIIHNLSWTCYKGEIKNKDKYFSNIEVFFHKYFSYEGITKKHKLQVMSCFADVSSRLFSEQFDWIVENSYKFNVSKEELFAEISYYSSLLDDILPKPLYEQLKNIESEQSNAFLNGLLFNDIDFLNNISEKSNEDLTSFAFKLKGKLEVRDYWIVESFLYLTNLPEKLWAEGDKYSLFEVLEDLSLSKKTEVSILLDIEGTIKDPRFVDMIHALLCKFSSCSIEEHDFTNFISDFMTGSRLSNLLKSTLTSYIETEDKSNFYLEEHNVCKLINSYLALQIINSKVSIFDIPSLDLDVLENHDLMSLLIKKSSVNPYLFPRLDVLGDKIREAIETEFGRLYEAGDDAEAGAKFFKMLDPLCDGTQDEKKIISNEVCRAVVNSLGKHLVPGNESIKELVLLTIQGRISELERLKIAEKHEEELPSIEHIRLEDS